MRLTITSLFRDNAGAYIDRYVDQVRSLVVPNFRCYMIEGDSRDDTYAQLVAVSEQDPRFIVVKHDTGMPRFGSVVSLDRFKCLTLTANAGWEAVAKDRWGSMHLHIESDLIYDPTLAIRLWRTISYRGEKTIVAPLVVAERSFYDIWGFRYLPDGEGFTPHLSDLKDYHIPFRVFSAGSCVFIPSQLIYNGLRLTEEECLVGMCKMAREDGVSVYCDPTTVVFHPYHDCPPDYYAHRYIVKPHLPQVG